MPEKPETRPKSDKNYSEDVYKCAVNLGGVGYKLILGNMHNFKK